MKPGNPGETDSPLSDLPLDEEHAHILIEYDPSLTPIHCLTETIETAGAKILEMTVLREGAEGETSVLIRLGIQDARNAVLSLSKYPLIRVEGYNSGEGLNRRESGKKQ